MGHRTKLLLTSILIVVSVSLIVGTITIGWLYRVSLYQREADLVHTVRSQARLMEAVAKADLSVSDNDPLAATSMTLRQFVDAHERFPGIGETGEFTLAKKEDDQIVFLLSHRHADRGNLQPVAWESDLAEPMRRALSGRSDTVIGLDYRGEIVVAAHEPVAGLNWGIVAKMDLAEIRAPFVRAGLITGAATILIMLAGVIVLVRVSKPLIDRLEQVEESVRESEERFRDLFEHANDLIQAVSPDGRFVYVNPAWCRSMGYQANEIDSLTVFDVIHPDSIDHCKVLFQEVMAGEEVGTIEAAFRAKDGTRILVEGNTSCQFDDHGKPVMSRSMFRDVTQRKQADDELRLALYDLAARTEQLVVAKEQAEAADRVKSAFLATMSHELRTPLNSIIGFTGIMAKGLTGPMNDEQTKQLGMVQGSARHLLSLINDILDISKIEAGQFEIECKPFDIGEAIDKAVKIVTPAAEQKHLRVRIQVAPEIGEVVGDQRRVEQVLLNLVNNAVKFTDTGEVCVSCELSDATIVTRVTDTGSGIKPDDMGTLFTAFQQLDSGIARQHEGTGLGLAICKRLVDLMGGGISVESVWNEGSTFSFTLPLHAAARGTSLP